MTVRTGGPADPPLSASRDASPEAWQRRRSANLRNGSTVLGLVLARRATDGAVPGPKGLLVAGGYRWPLPAAAAFTVGNVVLTRRPAQWLLDRPVLLAHESAHASQWARCLGLPFLPLYGLATAWSWLRTGDPASRNTFERRAGLAAGGYVERPPRRFTRRPARRSPARRPAPPAR